MTSQRGGGWARAITIAVAVASLLLLAHLLDALAALDPLTLSSGGRA